MRRHLAAVGFAIVLGVGATPAQAEGNQPPVAVDDPAIPGCVPVDHWGGAFPIVEDAVSPGAGAGYEDWSWFLGPCLPTANDTDADSSMLAFEVVGDPDHGDVTWFSQGSNSLLGYRPDPDYFTLPGDQPGGTWVSDEIQYRATDGLLWSNVASYRIWVAPVNDPPTFTPGADLVEGVVGGPTVSVPWATNIDPGPLESYQHVSFSVETDTRGAPGMFSVLPAIDGDGVLTFTPGTKPGLATVTATARDDGGLEDWDAGSSLGELPDDTSDPVTFEVVVWGPDLNDDQVTLTEDSGWLVDVLANDGGVARIVDATDGELGTVDVDDNAVVYWPAPNATGSDSFTYTAEDSGGRTATATVHVTITPVNDDPVAADDVLAVDADADATGVDVLANDGDVDGDQLAVRAAGPAGHGTVGLDAGAVSYQPEPGFSGADSFDYTVSDGQGGSDTATVSVNVATDAVPPEITPGTIGIAGTRIGQDTVRLRFAWGAADGGSGVASQAVQQRRPSGAWRLVDRPLPGVSSLTVDTTPGDTDALRVRATDARGNASAWAAWPEVEAIVRQETASSIAWSGTWRRGSDPGSSGHGTRWTTGTGRRATLDVRSRAVAWVGRRQPGGGRAEVWVDGVRVATVDTAAETLQRRAILFRIAWNDRATHHVQIRTLGGGRVDVDAFVIVR